MWTKETNLISDNLDIGDCADNDDNDNDDDKQKAVVRFTDYWLEIGLISIDPLFSCYSTILHYEMKKYTFQGIKAY